MPNDEQAAPPDVTFPAESPFRPAHFQRADDTDDSLFYRDPRLVTHIDDTAIAALRDHYARLFPPRAAVLDFMSSWVSHFPQDLQPSRAAGLGMNAHDLNREPALPYDDAASDIVTIAVSVQYLQRPLDVFREIQRVLTPGGTCCVSFSNSCFPTKAIALWTRTNDQAHAQIVDAYFHDAGGFSEPEVLQLAPLTRTTDPMYVVQARRESPDA